MADVDSLAAELDAVTAALELAAPYASIERLLRRRALLLVKLGAHLPAEGARESLRRALESGERVAAKVAAARISQREQLGRLYHAKALLEALRAPAVGRLDCQG